MQAFSACLNFTLQSYLHSAEISGWLQRSGAETRTTCLPYSPGCDIKSRSWRWHEAAHLLCWPFDLVEYSSFRAGLLCCEDRLRLESRHSRPALSDNSKSGFF